MSLLKEGEKIWVGEDYASVTWRAEDVHYLKPSWTLPRCEEWLEDNEDNIKDRLTELGYEVIGTLLSMEDDEEDDDE
jgi:hypothetical protein